MINPEWLGFAEPYRGPKGPSSYRFRIQGLGSFFQKPYLFKIPVPKMAIRYSVVSLLVKISVWRSVFPMVSFKRTFGRTNPHMHSNAGTLGRGSVLQYFGIWTRKGKLCTFLSDRQGGNLLQARLTYGMKYTYDFNYVLGPRPHAWTSTTL